MASQPVVFLEMSCDAPIGDRNSRFWAANGYGSVTLPEIIVDSGHQFTSGSKSDFSAAYRPLIETELARAPQAELEAYVRRVGDAFRVYATFTNHSGVTLLSTTNAAKIHAQIWEEAKVAVTSRYVRAAPFTSITTAVANDASASYTLDTETLTGVDWAKLHTVVMVDYRPGGAFTGAYDMLQAAIAQPAALVSSPPNLLFNVPLSSPGSPSSPLSFRGPYVVTWTAASDSPWLSVAPQSGALPADPAVSIDPAHLVAGSQTGHLTITGTSEDGLSLTASVPVVVNFTGALPGDVNGDGVFNVADVFHLINRLFASGPSGSGLSDPNGDSRTDAADIFYLVNHLFAGGPPPVG